MGLFLGVHGALATRSECGPTGRSCQSPKLAAAADFKGSQAWHTPGKPFTQFARLMVPVIANARIARRCLRDVIHCLVSEESATFPKK